MPGPGMPVSPKTRSPRSTTTPPNLLSPRERAAVRYARKLAVDHHKVDDALWAGAAHALLEADIIELTMHTTLVHRASGPLNSEVVGLDPASCPEGHGGRQHVLQPAPFRTAWRRSQTRREHASGARQLRVAIAIDHDHGQGRLASMEPLEDLVAGESR